MDSDKSLWFVRMEVIYVLFVDLLSNIWETTWRNSTTKGIFSATSPSTRKIQFSKNSLVSTSYQLAKRTVKTETVCETSFKSKQNTVDVAPSFELRCQQTRLTRRQGNRFGRLRLLQKALSSNSFARWSTNRNDCMFSSGYRKSD